MRKAKPKRCTAPTAKNVQRPILRVWAGGQVQREVPATDYPKPEGSAQVGLHRARGVLGHRPCDARADFADALSLAVVGNAACNIGRSPITTFSKMQDA